MILIVLFALALSIILVNLFSKPNLPRRIRIAYPNTWGALIPPLQHTLIASAIMSNEFEPLVQYGQDGVILPLSCLSFEVSDDFKIFKFHINTKKRFSDGTYLNSMIFKKSFEHGLKLQNLSHNQSALDGLYQLVGFDKFEKTGSISGIVSASPEILELHYQKPFRKALENLTGIRFSAYINKSDNDFIGTGPWKIQNFPDKRKVVLVPNIYSDDPKNFEIEIAVEEDWLEKLKENSIDIAEIVDFNILDCSNLKQHNISCLLGEEESHTVVHLNQLENRFFSNKNNRKAILYLLSELLKQPEYQYRIGNYLNKIDMQTFLPFQKGRLLPENILPKIEDGEKYVLDLIKNSKKNPIFFATARKDLFIVDFLKSKGIHFSNNTGSFSFDDIIKMGYKTSEPDILFISFSIVSGDPDGLYHALGANGAISFPMSQNIKITSLLEEGRALIEEKDIIKKYEELNYAIFEEVPIVHLGFQRQVSLYRSDNVKTLSPVVKRHDHRLNVYSPQE